MSSKIDDQKIKLATTWYYFFYISVGVFNSRVTQTIKRLTQHESMKLLNYIVA